MKSTFKHYDDVDDDDGDDDLISDRDCYNQKQAAIESAKSERGKAKTLT